MFYRAGFHYGHTVVVQAELSCRDFPEYSSMI